MIVAALAVAVLIASTSTYVYEVSRSGCVGEAEGLDGLVLALKQCVRNAVAGSLSNVSNGADVSSFSVNLEAVSGVFLNLHRHGLCALMSDVYNGSGYGSGLWLSWGDSGFGVSSGCANFMLNVIGDEASANVSFDVNVTTAVSYSGYYEKLDGYDKLVRITCDVLDGDVAGSVKNLTVLYQSVGVWTVTDASSGLSVLDYANGTCAVSFVAHVPSNDVPVSLRVTDVRDVFVMANLTCYEL
jgi:hypothetical protein